MLLYSSRTGSGVEETHSENDEPVDDGDTEVDEMKLGSAADADTQSLLERLSKLPPNTQPKATFTMDAGQVTRLTELLRRNYMGNRDAQQIAQDLVNTRMISDQTARFITELEVGKAERGHDKKGSRRTKKPGRKPRHRFHSGTALFANARAIVSYRLHVVAFTGVHIADVTCLSGDMLPLPAIYHHLP
ncbi:hypothetical protein HDU88_008405 [Geranomyces variabilis]|nr:hypothetical protein HDU88_008405 [Geranomyces variabilis]